MTDILVVNAELAALVASLIGVVMPVLMWLAYLAGRWSAARWYERNGAELAEAETRERYKDMVARLAEKDRSIEMLKSASAAKDQRIRSITAAVRGAQVQVGNVAEVLTLSELEAM